MWERPSPAVQRSEAPQPLTRTTPTKTKIKAPPGSGDQVHVGTGGLAPPAEHSPALPRVRLSRPASTTPSKTLPSSSPVEERNSKYRKCRSRNRPVSADFVPDKGFGTRSTEKEPSISARE